MPGLGAKSRAGSSALTRHSIAQPAKRDVGLRDAQSLARGDRDLLGDEVDAGDRLGHRMLHLDARVHLEKVELSRCGVDEKLDGAGAAILKTRGEPHAPPRAAARATRRGNPGAGVSSMSFW